MEAARARLEARVKQMEAVAAAAAAEKALQSKPPPKRRLPSLSIRTKAKPNQRSTQILQNSFFDARSNPEKVKVLTKRSPTYRDLKVKARYNQRRHDLAEHIYQYSASGQASPVLPPPPRPRLPGGAAAPRSNCCGYTPVSAQQY